MKNKYLIIALAVIMILSLTGCSKEPENNTIDNSTSTDKRDYKKIYGTKEACLESAIGGFIAGQYNNSTEKKLTDIVTVDMTKTDYSSVKVTDNGLIYVIVKTTDENTIETIETYFNENYSGYKKSIFGSDYHIYVYNEVNDFDELEIESSTKVCNFD